MGWTPVHVEASPLNFAALARNRPDCRNVHAALCQKEGVVHFIEPSAIMADESYIGAVSGILEFMAPGYIKKSWPIDSQGTQHSLYGPPATVTPINCRRLDTVLADLSLTHVDWWVLDVEGAEEEVIKTINLRNVTIDVVCVELDGRNPAKDANVVTFFEKNGYLAHSRYPAKLNMWFVRKGFALPTYLE